MFKAKPVMMTMPRSFADYVKAEGQSEFIQMHIAEKVIGIPFSEFVLRMNQPHDADAKELNISSSAEDLRLKKDTWEQEYIRLARWMLEGDILGFSRTANPNWLLLVKWKYTEVVNVVKVVSFQRQFNRVCYDSVYMSQEELDAALKEEGVKDYTDLNFIKRWENRIYAMDWFKTKIITRWAQLSGWDVDTMADLFSDSDITFTKRG